MQDSAKKLIMNWSGGKDATLALYYLLNEREFDVCGLLTSVNKEFGRISMHGVRQSLLIRQAAAIGLPLEILEIPGEVSMETYNGLMKSKMLLLKEQGITHAAFGDLFLEDLKMYRTAKLAEEKIEAVFPLWKKDTARTVREFLALGFKAVTVCVDAKYLDDSFVGRLIDEQFLRDLPSNVDPCGENGEFHSFVFDGPLFKSAIEFEIGEKVKRTFESAENTNWNNAFWYCDLVG
ncbi:MAG: diphthine--ammonia ligase [Bacteroidetes bacterium]|nr:diphthine--ammonia ligase [Bacteroidota bacterium]